MPSASIRSEPTASPTFFLTAPAASLAMPLILSVVPLILFLRMLRPSGPVETKFVLRKARGRSIPSVMPKQGDQDDDWKRHADKPEQSSTTESHSVLLFFHLPIPEQPQVSGPIIRLAAQGSREIFLAKYCWRRPLGNPIGLASENRLNEGEISSMIGRSRLAMRDDEAGGSNLAHEPKDDFAGGLRPDW